MHFLIDKHNKTDCIYENLQIKGCRIQGAIVSSVVNNRVNNKSNK